MAPTFWTFRLVVGSLPWQGSWQRFQPRVRKDFTQYLQFSSEFGKFISFQLGVTSLEITPLLGEKKPSLTPGDCRAEALPASSPPSLGEMGLSLARCCQLVWSQRAGILLHPWHLERNKGCKGCVRDRKRRDACDCTPAILYCQKPPEGGGGRRPGEEGQEQMALI